MVVFTPRTMVKGASAVAIAALFSTMAMAGGFVNTSQSTVYNGMAYAGFTAGGGKSPSAMFLNPAIMTQFKTITTENNLFAIMPTTKITGTARSATGTVIGVNPSGDIGQDAIAPASYFIVPLGEKIVVGLSINSPFGLTTKPDNNWGGQFNSVTTSLKTYNFTPSIAYAVTDNFSIGAGLQVQYATAKLWSMVTPTIPGSNAGIKGDGFGFGGVLGATWQPIKGTHLGIGWRTFIDQEIDGDTWVTTLATTTRQSKGTLNLPNRVNASLRQEFGSNFDFLASVEWQNWGRIGHAAISNPATSGLAQLPFGYKDGWFFSLGGEYKATKELTLRTGVGYEISPVNDQVRSTRLPDNDRIWLSVGASYEITNKFALNASYSHVFVKDANINVVSGNPNLSTVTGISYVGQSKAHVDIFSIGLTSKWGDAPKKEEPLVRKF